MDNLETDPAHSWYPGNIFHYDPFADANRANENDRYWRMDNDAQKRPIKGAVLFQILWALFVVIPIFFWWEEITEMAFIIFR